MSGRIECMKHICVHLHIWPKNGEYEHIRETYLNYHWHFDGKWVLKDDMTGDVISQKEIEQFRLTEEGQALSRLTTIPSISGLYWYYRPNHKPEPVLVDTERYGAGKFKGFNGRIQSWMREDEYLKGPQAPM